MLPPAANAGLKVQRGSRSEDLGDGSPPTRTRAEPLVGVWVKAPRS